jgi:hypothetical protein
MMSVDKPWKQIIMTQRNPYLATGRLQKVLALIQILGTNVNDDIDIDRLVELSGDKKVNTQAVLKEHPEFFGKDRTGDNEYWHLVMRRTGSLSVHKDTGKLLENDEITAKNVVELKTNYRRPRLAATQVECLMKTAVELHARAIASEEERRWLWKILLPAVFSFFFSAVFTLVLRFNQTTSNKAADELQSTKVNSSLIHKTTQPPSAQTSGRQKLKSSKNFASSSP